MLVEVRLAPNGLYVHSITHNVPQFDLRRSNAVLQFAM
jgi:hypothetical protein